MDSIKPGDTIPILGSVRVEVNGVDVTADQDFSLWVARIEFKQVRGSWEYAAELEIDADGVFISQVDSEITALLPADSTITYDMRVRDQDGVVVSSRTQDIFVASPISEIP